MADVRDDGIAALERGDNGAAAALLSEACRLDHNDFPAYLGLGQALLRTGQADAAVTVLERAVALAPPSPDARRELGIALAAAGRTPEAVRTLQHALSLRPNDRVALEVLDRIRQQAAPRHEIALPVYSAITRPLSPDPSTMGTATSGDAFATAEPGAQSGLFARRPLSLDPDAAVAEPTLHLPAASVTPMPSNPTGHEPTLYVMARPVEPHPGEQAIPHYGFPAQLPAGATHPWPRAVEPEDGRHDDDFSVADGYYDLLEILASPHNFFAAQAGREGNRAPLSMLVVYTLNIVIGLLAVLFTAGAQLGPSGMIVVLLSPFGFLLLYALLTTVALGGAALLHGACALFRGRGTYSGSFRAAVYAAAPVCTAITLGLVLSPIKPQNALLASLLTALPYALIVVAPLWSVLLLSTACCHIHNLSLRAIIAVLLLMAATCIGVGFAFSLLPAWT